MKSDWLLLSTKRRAGFRPQPRRESRSDRHGGGHCRIERLLPSPSASWPSSLPNSAHHVTEVGRWTQGGVSSWAGLSGASTPPSPSPPPREGPPDVERDRGGEWRTTICLITHGGGRFAPGPWAILFGPYRAKALCPRGVPAHHVSSMEDVGHDLGGRFSHFRVSARLTSIVVLLLLFAIGDLTAKVVRDEVGRSVELPDNPQRIVSLAPSITETLFALGLESRIAGVTDYCNFPEGARLKPHVGGIINPNVERIIALKPDLLLVTTEANKAEILTQMAKFHIPVFATSPRSIEGVFQSIHLMGEATNTRDRAQELVNELQSRRQHVLDKVKGLKRPRTLILYDLNPIVAGGRHTYPTDLIQSAGGTSITAVLAQDWPRLNIEFIVEKDPEIIFVTEMPSALSGPRALRTLSGWKLTSAVKHNRIYLLDDRVNHPSPRIIEALELLARRIHPEAFGE